jgi:hypothetical protein
MDPKEIFPFTSFAGLTKFSNEYGYFWMKKVGLTPQGSKNPRELS